MAVHPDDLPAAPHLTVKPPSFRQFSIYALDPAVAVSNATAAIAFDTVKVPWEPAYDAPLRPGPINEYLEVIDVDPASGRCYPPVDLSAPNLLAQNGHIPSENNPQFHQQMAFAVAMRTIRIFELALGRRVIWSRRTDVPLNLPIKDEIEQCYVRRLRLYPHALRGENAYYSPSKKAVLLGYYRAGGRDVASMTGSWVFGALQHDVIAHEVTHAIIDGINPRLIEDVDPDALAMHEGLSDIVALLQHFTLPDVVKAAIRDQKSGKLDGPTILSGIASQFGRASERTDQPVGAIRDAVGAPDPEELATLTEQHARGARLLWAVYAAFVEIYTRATADILQLVGPEARTVPLSPLLVDRLAQAAGKTATRLLRICIRALDLLPPTSATFTDYLRALVTSDADLYPEDLAGYRRALILQFRRYGAIRAGIRSLAEESIRWPPPPLFEDIARLESPDIDTEPLSTRCDIHRQSMWNAVEFHGWLVKNPKLCLDLGLAFRSDDPPSIKRPFGREEGVPAIEVHSVRLCRRATDDGREVRQLVALVTQRRQGWFDEDMQRRVDAGEIPATDEDFLLRGGVTLVFSMLGDKGDRLLQRLRYVVKQPLSDDRLAAVRSYRAGRAAAGLGMAYTPPGEAPPEPLAMLHAERGLADA